MTDKYDKTWTQLAKQARKGERHIITGEAADRLLEELADEELAEDEVEDIVEAIVSERRLEEVRSARAVDDVVTPVDAPETQAVEEDVLQLNRNKGDEDSVAEALAEKLRREALEEDEDA